MKQGLLLFLWAAMVLPAAAQIMPLQLEVKPLIMKKDVSVTFANGASYVQSRSLKITVRNTAPRPVTGVTVRWGIVKQHQSARANSKNPGTEAYGAEEKFDLKPLEIKILETATVDAEGHRYNYVSPLGDKIIGHGVQVMLDGKVVLEEIVPPTVKETLTKLHPVGPDAGDSPPSGRTGKSSKSR